MRFVGKSEQAKRRGVLVTPAEVEWIIKRNATDLTSRSLQGVACRLNGPNMEDRSINEAQIEVDPFLKIGEVL